MSGLNASVLVIRNAGPSAQRDLPNEIRIYIESPVNYKTTLCKVMTEINCTSNDKYSHDRLRMWLPYPSLSYNEVGQLISNKVASSKRASEFPGFLLTEANIHNLAQSSCRIVAETRQEGEEFTLQEPESCAKCQLKLASSRICCKCLSKIYCSTECRDLAAHCGAACKFCNGIPRKRVTCACGEVTWCDDTCSSKGQRLHKCKVPRASRPVKLLKTSNSRIETKPSTQDTYHKPINRDRVLSYNAMFTSPSSSIPIRSAYTARASISSYEDSKEDMLPQMSQKSSPYLTPQRTGFLVAPDHLTSSLSPSSRNSLATLTSSTHTAANMTPPQINSTTVKASISKGYSYGTSFSFKSNESIRSSMSPARRSLVGLRNLGNTCYMNSTLQCLAYLHPLSEYFLNSFSVDHINTENKLGSRGKLTLAYVRLLRDLMRSSTSISPYDFKTELGHLVSQFDGYDQHDASELLEYLLDAIHEDLNRVTDKTYVMSQIGDELPNGVMAELSWRNYQSRNSSIVTDLFGGQYRSEVTCTLCGKVSVTFDPYLTMHLNIPSDIRQETDVTVVFADPDQLAIKFKLLTSSQASIKSIKQEISDALGKDPDTLTDFIVNNNTIVYRRPTLGNDSKGTLFFYEFNENLKGIDVWINISKTFPARPGSQLRDSHPRHFRIPEEASLKTLHFEIFKYLKRCVDRSSADSNLEMDTPDDNESLELQFKLAFPSLLGQPGVDLYSLKVINLFKGLQPCSLCGEKYCRSCSLPFQDNSILDIFAAERQVNLDAVFILSSSWLVELRKTVDHPSVSKVAKELAWKNQHNLTLYECFEHTCKAEELDEDNTAYCSKCRDQVKIVKKIEVWSVPKLLVIVLKRFKQQGFLTSKVTKVIDFPIEGLDLSKHVLKGVSGVYDLYAVSNHIGSLGFGHYTAFAKHEGLWYEFDDSRVNVLHRGLQPSDAAYVLCYIRREA